MNLDSTWLAVMEWRKNAFQKYPGESDQIQIERILNVTLQGVYIDWSNLDCGQTREIAKNKKNVSKGRLSLLLFKGWYFTSILLIY